MMAVELFVPGFGCAFFGEPLTCGTLEELLIELCALPADECRQLFDEFELKDPESGVSVRVVQCARAPLSGVELSLLLVAEVRAFRSRVAFCLKWTRANASPTFVSSPNLETACGACLSCGDALPPDVIFGRCAPCESAFRTLTMESDTTLPDRHRQ
jgi:hypothetical protein